MLAKTSSGAFDLMTGFPMLDCITRIVAIRHGETAWNVEGRIQGHLDIPLNELGRWQAQRLAEALVGEGIDIIYASDLRRAAETAEVLAQICKVPLVFDLSLRERDFGCFQGQTFREIEVLYPEDANRWRRRDLDYRPGGGESLTTFSARCMTAVHRLAGGHPGQTIGLVAHGGVIDCLYRAATQQDMQVPRSWPLGNASINRLLYTGAVLSLVGWSDTRHLDNLTLDEAGLGDLSGQDRVGPLA